MEDKKYALDKITTAFQNAIRDVESLNEFYYRSNKTLVDYQLRTEESCLQGKQIADLLDQVLECEEQEDRGKKIAEIKSVEIEPGVILSDICDIMPCSDNETNTLSYSMKDGFKNQLSYSPREARRKYDHIRKYDYILKESILSHIVVSFENYLSQIYRVLLILDPLKYFENQTIPLAAIFKENFSETIIDKVNSEVENKMRNSLETLSYISEKEEITVDRYEKILELFKEVYYRRNAYVHTSGKANKDYMKKVDSKLLRDVVENEFLVVDDIYINNAIVILCKLIFSIAYELVVKLNGDEEYVESLSDCFFEKLKNKEYALTKYVYRCLSQYKNLSFRERTMYRINYINSLKHLNEEDLVKSELSSLDVSIATDDFKIAKECLSNNNEQVYKMLLETYPKSFDAVTIREWPIFVDFRETSYYSDFVEQFKSDFEVQQISAEQCVSQDVEVEETLI